MAHKETIKHHYFNFNTVEKTLLACSIFVCMAGVMFESERYQGETTNRSEWERELITYIVIIVVTVSLLYYAVVFASEICGVPVWMLKMCASRKQAHELHLEEGFNDDINGGDFELSANPIVMNGTAKANKAAEAAIANMQEQLNEQQKRIRNMNKKSAMEKTDRRPRSRKNVAKGKKSFTPTAVRKSQEPSATGQDANLLATQYSASGRAALRRGGRKRASLQKAQRSPSPELKQNPTSDGPQLPEGWEVGHDQSRGGMPYYFNRSTGQRSWTKPTAAGSL